jgi:hypothetical protein
MDTSDPARDPAWHRHVPRRLPRLEWREYQAGPLIAQASGPWQTSDEAKKDRGGHRAGGSHHMDRKIESFLVHNQQNQLYHGQGAQAAPIPPECRGKPRKQGERTHPETSTLLDKGAGEKVRDFFWEKERFAIRLTLTAP